MHRSNSIQVSIPDAGTLPVRYAIYSVVGIVVAEGELPDSNKIDITGIPAGAYVLRIVTDRRSYVK